jgi:hypothetical protein
MQRRKKMDIQPADKRPSQGGILDGRTRRARRRRELIAAYSNALGGDAALTDGQRVDIRKASELVALAEDARATALREGPGTPGMLSAMVRLQSASSRAVAALGLPVPGRSKSSLRYGKAEPVPTLADYLAGRQAEEK